MIPFRKNLIADSLRRTHHDAWHAALGPVAPVAHDAVYEVLNRFYGEKGRYYHDWTHVQGLLAHHDHCWSANAAPERDEGINGHLVRLAIFWHDVVYDPQRQDNERTSAHLFETFAALAAPAEAVQVGRVVEMIDATTHRYNPDLPPLAQYLCDLDLLGLASEPRQYEANTRAIRYEFRHVVNEDWLQGRCTWLAYMQGRPVYYNPFGIAKFADHEKQARANLAREYERMARLLDGIRNSILL